MQAETVKSQDILLAHQRNSDEVSREATDEQAEDDEGAEEREGDEEARGGGRLSLGRGASEAREHARARVQEHDAVLPAVVRRYRTALSWKSA